MELDIDIELHDFPKDAALELAKRFEVEFAGQETADAYQKVIVRYSAESTETNELDSVVRDFLNGLASYAEAVKPSSAMLRLGIFYDLSETVIFPLHLSAGTISVLSELDLGIDATGYPCSEGSEEDE